YKAYEDHMKFYEALENTMKSDQSKGIAAPSSLKTAPSAEYTAWTTIDTRLRPSVS
ncbi:hypothetical protein Tco_0391905, partial [Tanacetum coccineum]